MDVRSTSRMIESADGVRLFVREGGNPDGPAILMLHGWSQHHLCWTKQFEGPLAKNFRLIAPDMRGHGASDKPDDVNAYQPSRVWAEDVAAVIDGCGLDRPLLVGWSMGGRVAMDFTHHFGDSAISGLVLVGSSVVPPSDPSIVEARRPDVRAEGMYSQDQRVALAATIAFVKACVAAPLSKMDLAMMVGYNMLVPPHVRRAARLRPADHEPDFSRTAVPISLFWGEADRVCLRPMVDATLEAMPDADLVTFPGTGHAPFWERAEMFDSRLADFAQGAYGVAA